MKIKHIRESIADRAKRWDDIGYIIISACIDPTDPEQKFLSSEDGKGSTNSERTKNLAKEINDAGYSFMKANGVYMGGAEKSFMVFGCKHDSEGNVQDVPFDILFKFGRKLCAEYTQYSFFAHDKGSDSVNEYYNYNAQGKPESKFKNQSFNVDNADYATIVGKYKKSGAKHGFTTQIDDDFEVGERGLGNKRGEFMKTSSDFGVDDKERQIEFGESKKIDNSKRRLFEAVFYSTCGNTEIPFKANKLDKNNLVNDFVKTLDF